MVHKIRKIRKKNITSGSESLNKIYFNKNTHTRWAKCVCAGMAAAWKCVNYILKGEMVRGEGMRMMVRLLQVATFNHEGVCLAKLEAA